MSNAKNTSKPDTSAKKNSYEIGVIAFNTEKEYYDEVTAGINDAAATYKQKINIHSIGVNYNLRSQTAALDELEGKDLDGLIITPFNVPEIQLRLSALVKKGVKVVTLNSDIHEVDRLCYVGSNAYKTGEVAGGLMKLITGGTAEIAIITGSNDLLGHSERVRGFIDTVSKKPTNISIEALCDCRDDSYKAYEMVQRIVLDHPTVDTFFFAAGGVYGGCKGIQQMTIRHQFKVLTFDDFATNRAFLQSGIITASICQDCNKQGSLALTALADNLIIGKTPEHDKYYTDITFKIKECL